MKNSIVLTLGLLLFFGAIVGAIYFHSTGTDVRVEQGQVEFTNISPPTEEEMHLQLHSSNPQKHFGGKPCFEKNDFIKNFRT